MNSDKEFDDLDLDRLPGICDNDYRQNNNNPFLVEDKIPFCPRISEEPLKSKCIKNLINEEINNIKKTPKENEIFSFKMNKENININNKIKKIKRDNNIYNAELNDKMNNINKNRLENDKKKIKANVLKFEELVQKKNDNKLKKSNEKKMNNKKIKIDFSRKLYQNKKIYGENKDEKNEKTLKEINKRSIKDLLHNKSEKSINSKRPEIKMSKSPNNISKKIPIYNNNKKDKILFNYFKLDNSSKKKEKITMKYKDKNIVFNFDKPEDRTNKSFIIENNSRDNSLIMNKSNRTMKSKRKMDKLNIMNEIENKIKSALNKDISRKKNKRYSKINDELINFDNSKFENYDTEQFRYGLIKDYSFIHPEKSENFLERMEFDYYKRKNKEKKINELVEQNKNRYKLNESKRKKAFNRLNEDANRRIILKQELLENEKYLTDYGEMLDNSKKYNQDEWDKIYNKRFKQYEDIKKKKIDIQRQNEKIKKMIKEEEEINMCKTKKIPLRKIKENTERLYNDAKKRELLKNNKNLTSDKSAKNFNFYKNNICLTSFDDFEKDNSKYLKNYKEVEYNFSNNKKINLNRNNSRLRMNKILNKSFDRKNMKKTSKISVTEFNNMRFEKNNNIIKYPKKKINKKIPFNYNLNFKNYIEPYFKFKKNIKQNTPSKSEYSPTFTMPLEYNYNNYNIYNINNLNNNINTNLNSNNNNINDEDDYLNNITNQLLQSAALKKIESNYLNNNQIINNNISNDQYNNYTFKDKEQKEGNLNNNINFNNQDNEQNQMIEEFLSSKFQI